MLTSNGRGRIIHTSIDYQSNRYHTTAGINMRLLVTGSRTYPDKVCGTPAQFVISMLNGLWIEGTSGYKTTDLYGFTIVEGGWPTGVDRIARWWAKRSPIHSYDEFPIDLTAPIKWPDNPPFCHKSMPADWERYGKAAGPIRNGWMVKYLLEGDTEEERLVIGFVDKSLEQSRGTCDCIDQARAAKLPVLVTRLY